MRKTREEQKQQNFKVKTGDETQAVTDLVIFEIAITAVKLKAFVNQVKASVGHFKLSHCAKRRCRPKDRLTVGYLSLLIFNTTHVFLASS